MNVSVKGGIGLVVAVTFYTSFVAYDTTMHRYAIGPNPEFSPGSADDVINQKLRAGDLIIFSRRWYNYHLPQALAIKLYQWIHDTPCDHIGIIVTDKYGKPYVFEQTFFRGHKIRPFEERILYSRAQQITAIMLMPRDDRDEVVAEKRSNKLDEYVSLAIASGGGIGGWYREFIHFFSPEATAPCKNLRFVQEVYECLDMDLVLEVKNDGAKVGRDKTGTRMDCKGLLHRYVRVRERVCEQIPNIVEREEVRGFSRSDVLVRTN